MSKIITGFEFAILVAIIIGIIILLNIMEARRRINAVPKEEDDDQAKEDEAQRRRMVHEADSYNQAASMEPFCGGSDAQTKEQERHAQEEADRQSRSRQAIRRAQQAAHDSLINKVAARSNIFVLSPEQIQEIEDRREAEWKQQEQRRKEIRQHNSSFRALGMTPLSLYGSKP